MLKQFLNHIADNDLCTTHDNVLLAVSGGVDSMVMLHLFLEAGYDPAVVHCNFQLRPEAEDEEEHVKEVCSRFNLTCHTHKFDTETYAQDTHLSIQVAARELRYKLFHELIREQGYNCVATAHHVNDNLETVLMNFIRGTGIEGIAGIPVKNGPVIRPLLFATREAITRYAQNHNIIWKEDSSNNDDHYKRNLIRNNVVPILKNINPNLEEVFLPTIYRLNAAKHLVNLTINAFKADAVIITDESMVIDMGKLYAINFPDVVLWETIKHLGFSFDQCMQIIKEHQSGKRFFTPSHELTIDREKFIIRSLEVSGFAPVVVDKMQGKLCMHGRVLTFEVMRNDNFVLDPDQNVAQMDLEALQFPLTWRKWKAGDHFNPLGMSRRKKLSDFLIDLKVPRPVKDEITVLESKGEIIWIVGYRISNHVRLTTGTKEILIIKYTSPGNDFM